MKEIESKILEKHDEELKILVYRDFPRRCRSLFICDGEKNFKGREKFNFLFFFLTHTRSMLCIFPLRHPRRNRARNVFHFQHSHIQHKKENF